jgi:hypothetical protein
MLVDQSHQEYHLWVQDLQRVHGRQLATKGLEPTSRPWLDAAAQQTNMVKRMELQTAMDTRRQVQAWRGWPTVEGAERPGEQRPEPLPAESPREPTRLSS